MKRIVITCGDPAGIGPEVVEKALAIGGFPDGCEFDVLAGEWQGVMGQPDLASAMVAKLALESAVTELRSGRADGVVTAPVCKEGLSSVGFDFPGQTEFFAEAFGVKDFGMLLTGERLTVGLVTIHEAMVDVPRLLTEERIIRCGRLVAGYLRDRGNQRVKIAVAGLNPHAGEGGMFGLEEIEVITPAIERLNGMGLGEFVGPCVPDAIFREAATGGYDAVLAMYHDQGLIPLKLLDFETAVNVTMGLPVIRTSPDHGTAFGIAGKGVADARSMHRAMVLACEWALGREG